MKIRTLALLHVRAALQQLLPFQCTTIWCHLFLVLWYWNVGQLVSSLCMRHNSRSFEILVHVRVAVLIRSVVVDITFSSLVLSHSVSYAVSHLDELFL